MLFSMAREACSVKPGRCGIPTSKPLEGASQPAASQACAQTAPQMQMQTKRERGMGVDTGLKPQEGSKPWAPAPAGVAEATASCFLSSYRLRSPSKRHRYKRLRPGPK